MATETTISSLHELQERKLHLENKLIALEGEMKGTYDQLKTNLQPQNILQEVTESFAPTGSIKKRLIKILIGVVVTYFSKKTAEKIVRHYINKWIDNKPDSWLTKLLSIFRN